MLNRLHTFAVLCCYFGIFAFAKAQPTCANTDGSIFVTNSNDAGPGSLRAAIDCANTSFGPNLIKFNLSTNQPFHVIQVGSTTGQALPALTDHGTVIDGTTQSGFGINGNYQPKIVLDGAYNTWLEAINAIWILGDSIGIYGLEIRNFPDDGIDVTVGNYATIGAPNKGNVIYGCGAVEDFFPNSSPTGPWNGCGIVFKQGANFGKVQGNTIGSNYARTLANGNEYCGIIVQNGGDDMIFGGTAIGQGNYINDHDYGVLLSSGSQRCLIRGNEFRCNRLGGIALTTGANGSIQPPIITEATNARIYGTAITGQTIDVYMVDSVGCRNTPCQGKILLGTTIAVNGFFTLQPPFINGYYLTGNEVVTATASYQSNTSTFSACFQAVNPCSMTVAFTNILTANCGNPVGGFTVQATGGGSNYQYRLGQLTQTQPFFSGLTAGSYTIIVSGAAGCTATGTVAVPASVPPTATVTNTMMASCGLANGSFTIQASGGTSPYQYRLGLNPTSSNTFNNLSTGTYQVTVVDARNCSTTVSATITGGPSTTISNIQATAADCGIATGSIQVTAGNGTAPYTYTWTGPSSAVGANPMNLLAGNYQLTVTDAQGCSATNSATVTEDGNAPMALFSAIDTYLEVQFTNESQGGSTYFWDYGDGNTFSGLSQIHTYSNPGNYEVCLIASNPCGQDTLCAFINVTANIPTTQNIGGNIKAWFGNQAPIPNAIVQNNLNTTTARTNTSGNYALGGQVLGTTLTIEAVKDTNHLNGVTTFDILLISRHVLGIDTFTNLYQMVAADASNNGVVTTFDMVVIRSLVLDITQQFPSSPSWKFIDASATLPPMNGNYIPAISYAKTITVASQNNGHNFIGVKIGDVNGTANPNAFYQPQDRNAPNEAVAFLSTEDKPYTTGSSFRIPIHIAPGRLVQAATISLTIDPTLGNVYSIVPIAPITTRNVHLKDNRITISWEGIEPAALSFELVAEIQRNCHPSDWLSIDLDAAGAPSELVFCNGNRFETTQKLQWQFEKATPQSSPHVFPNPAVKSTQITWEATQSGTVQIQLLDAQGKICFQQSTQEHNGQNQYLLPLQAHWPAGIYWIQWSNPYQKWSKPLQIVR